MLVWGDFRFAEVLKICVVARLLVRVADHLRDDSVEIQHLNLVRVHYFYGNAIVRDFRIQVERAVVLANAFHRSGCRPNQWNAGSLQPFCQLGKVCRVLLFVGNSNPTCSLTH